MAAAVQTGAPAWEISSQAIARLNLPPAVLLALRTIHCCQFIGRKVWQLQLRSNYVGAYVAGVLLNERYGGNELLRVTAQIIQTSRIFLSITEDSADLAREVVLLKRAFRIPVFSTAPMAVERLSQEEWMSQEGKSLPMHFLPWPIVLVGRCVGGPLLHLLRVARQTWRLGLRLFELHDCLNMGPHGRSAAVDDLFIELQQILSQAVGGEGRLAQAIETHGRWLEPLLATLGVRTTVDGLVRALRSVSSTVEEVSATCQPLAILASEVAHGACKVSASFVKPPSWQK